MNKTTHIGTITTESYMGPTKYQRRLKETPKFWVTEHGDRYRKDTADQNGVIRIRRGDTWNRWTSALDTKSIRPLTTEEHREPLVALVNVTTAVCDEARVQLDKATAEMERATAARQQVVEALAAFDAKRGNR